MLKSKEQQARSFGLTNVSEKNNSGSNYELIKREQVEGTPFMIITTEHGSFIALGQYRITEDLKKEQLLQMIEDKDWTLYLAAASAITELTIKDKQINNN